MLPVALLLALPGLEVDYARDIQPILADRCFACHGPDSGARMAGLRLDSLEGATADRGGYSAVTPHDPSASELIARITHADPAERMPPTRTRMHVSEAELELLERWIEEGAEYAPHWAFVSPQRAPAELRAEPSEWARDPLDEFVLRSLTAHGLAPAEEADRARWLRRVTFDLTGLPPTPAELAEFEADNEAGAHERVVDRLFSSPHHGERLGSMWLDVARYADTSGYQSDIFTNVWPWRDWVIQAYNENLPYDQFLTWQIAGDLLPDATQDQVLATAFNRLHRFTNEGGSIEEEYRIEYVCDRTQTFATAFLGLTLECARCHDHKFDPISQREYFALTAFFNSIQESGLASHFTGATPTPAVGLARPHEARQIAASGERIADLEAELEQALGEQHDALPAPHDLASIGGCEGHYPLDALMPVTDEQAKKPKLVHETIWPGKQLLTNTVDADNPGHALGGVTLGEGVHGKALALNGDAPAAFPNVGQFNRWQPATISLWLFLPKTFERAVIAHMSRASTDSGSQGWQMLVEEGLLTASLVHFLPGDALTIRSLERAPVGRWFHLALTYDGSSQARGLRIWVDGLPAASEVVLDGLRHMIRPGSLSFGLAPTLGARFRDRGLAGCRLDEFAVFSRALSALEVRALYEDVTGTPPARPESEFERARHAAVHSPRVQALEAQLLEQRHALAKLVDKLPKVMCMRELEQPREAHLLQRGQYDARGEVVQRGTPACLPPFPADAPHNRLGLARWLTAPDHPLTARVATNRLWQLIFGRGLVETSEDFGVQGRAPSHPALLDELALDLIDSGWNQRALLRRFVLSATYRQTSRAGPRARELDPDNRLLSRGPSARLSAEMLRDQALFAAGLMTRTVGGRPVYPYQPAGLWAQKGSGSYQQSKGPELYRRALYTFWKRNAPPPAMLIFDATTRAVCRTRRSSTNTPLQSLALWNDPQFVEAARALAQRTLLELPGESDEARIELVWSRLTCRSPRPVERDALVAALDTWRAEFSADQARARALLAVGDSEPEADLPAAESAAWTLIATTIMASDASLVVR